MILVEKKEADAWFKDKEARELARLDVGNHLCGHGQVSIVAKKSPALAHFEEKNVANPAPARYSLGSCPKPINRSGNSYSSEQQVTDEKRTSEAESNDITDELKLRIKKLERASSDLASACKHFDARFGAACDSFTSAARGVAATMLEERIRRSFSTVVVDGKSIESHAEKVNHSRRIRSWLSDWNFRFLDKASGEGAQLFAGTSGKKSGSYILCLFGEDGTQAKTMSWSKVHSTVCSPNLVPAASVGKRGAERS